MKRWSLDARNGDHTSRLAECGDEFALVGRAQGRAVGLPLVEVVVYREAPQIRAFRHFAS
jgi:hypothetical protein